MGHAALVSVGEWVGPLLVQLRVYNSLLATAQERHLFVVRTRFFIAPSRQAECVFGVGAGSGVCCDEDNATHGKRGVWCGSGRVRWLNIISTGLFDRGSISRSGGRCLV